MVYAKAKLESNADTHNLASDDSELNVSAKCLRIRTAPYLLLKRIITTQLNENHIQNVPLNPLKTKRKSAVYKESVRTAQ
jgi:hypothetical protein